METKKSYDFKSSYKNELREALIRESNVRLEIDVIDDIANNYVKNLELTDTELLHKDPSAIASDMINGMKPEMFISE